MTDTSTEDYIASATAMLDSLLRKPYKEAGPIGDHVKQETLTADAIAEPLCMMADALILMRETLVDGGFSGSTADTLVLLTFSQGMKGV